MGSASLRGGTLTAEDLGGERIGAARQQREVEAGVSETAIDAAITNPSVVHAAMDRRFAAPAVVAARDAPGLAFFAWVRSAVLGGVVTSRLCGQY